MHIGAVITAAGMSLRMGAFKPMLRFGPTSAAERIISTLRQSGVDLIVAVTGSRADELEKHLTCTCVVFVRNKGVRGDVLANAVVKAEHFCVGVRCGAK